MAASEPMAPMAMPMSARRSTGASLMPSPTKASFSRPLFAFSSASTCATLSAGSSSACTSSTPRSAATRSATLALSPVSITVRRTPAAFSARTASFAVGFSTSRDQDVPGVLPAYGHVHDGAHAAAGDGRDADALHQLVVARGHLDAVHLGDDAPAR